MTFNEVNASLYSALGEAAFLTGLERNQDIVTMSCYAPLFMKSQYKSWFPNLIVFNNHESYGIPSYYMLQMMGQSRGDYVLEAEISSDLYGEEKHGMAGLYAQSAGAVFRNVKINGVPQSALRANLSGEFTVRNGLFTAKTDEASCVFGAEEAGAYTLSVDLRPEDKKSMIKLSVWNERMDSIGSIFVPEWAPKRFKCFEWVLEDGVSCVRHIKRSLVQQESEKVPLPLGGEGTDHLEMTAKGDRIECLCNGRTVHSYQVEKIPAISGVATLDEKSGEVIVKLVNITDDEQQVTIRLDCEAEPAAAGLILRSQGKDDANSFEQKTLVSPEEFTVNGVSSSFTYSAPRYSLSILRLKLR